MGNKGKLYSITKCLVFIFLICILPAASAKEITVDDYSGADFRLIQEAVNNSVPGDIIIVRSGNYTENIFVNITGLTVRSESKNNNVQLKPLNDSESVFLIKADNVTISGFNITGANKEIPDRRGVIYLENAGNCSITGNIFIENKIGVSLYRSNYNTISENLFFNSELNEEIVTYQADMNKMIGNTIENGYITQGAESSGDLIAGNKISNGGIFVSCCGGGHIVSGNTISNCSIGIDAYDVGVNISNNRITNCDYGINLDYVASRIDNNTILYCDVGIDLGDGGSVELIDNTVISSAECGIVTYGDNRRIYNNYFNNTVNVRLGENRENFWNSSLTQGTNIVGGPYIGGNFWAKPDGTGFSQICVDLNGDGIGDLPYYINGSDIDYLPLVSASRLQESIIPIANFSTNITKNLAPLTVQFKDLSKNAILWSWDLNGDGYIDSTEQNPIFLYTTPGNYTVNLTVSNGKDRDSKIQEIIMKKGKVPPIANFSTNVTSGQVPLSVRFTDLSQNVTSREWDFNDDGLADSGNSNPVYVYTYPGVYTVNLTVSNEYGIASKTAVISVLSENNSGDSSNDSSGGSSSDSSSSSGGSNSVSSSSSGGSSSGSGGGAGSSPEPAKNVEAKEISQTFVTKGIPAKFDFTKNATCVMYVSFDAKKTFGKTTSIAEQLKGKSSLVSELPEDETYKSFNIWVGNSGFANAGNLENAVICFRVDKSWIQDKNINQSSVTLNRYSEKKWNELPASLLKQDDRYLYFTSRTPGFSPFAITGKMITKEANNEVQPATVTEMQPEPDIKNYGQYSTEVEKKSGQNSTEVEQKSKKDKSEILSVLAVICLMACIFVPFVRKKY